MWPTQFAKCVEEGRNINLLARTWTLRLHQGMSLPIQMIFFLFKNEKFFRQVDIALSKLVRISFSYWSYHLFSIKLLTFDDKTYFFRCDGENFNQDSESHFRDQNGLSPHSTDYQVELNNPSGSLEEENTYSADDNFDEEDEEDTGNDGSKSNELSGNYLLNITLDNLKQIKDAVQSKFLVFVELRRNSGT